MNSSSEEPPEQAKDVDDLIKNYGIQPPDDAKEKLIRVLEEQRQAYIIMAEFRQNSQDLSK